MSAAVFLESVVAPTQIETEQQSHLVVDLFGREIGRWGVNKILVAGVNVRSSEIAAVRQSTGSVEN